MDKIIIGFGNKARQGKDYSARVLKNVLGDKSVIMHFADALYQELQQDTPYGLIYPYWHNNLISSNLYCVFDCYAPSGTPIYKLITSDDLFRIFNRRGIAHYKKMETKDGEMLQWWGTNYRRAEDEDYWIKKLEEQINMLDENIKYILIPDTRFLNEYNYIKHNNGIYIKVIATINGKQYIAADRPAYHRSETELDNVEADYVIKAERGDLESLKKQVYDISQSIINK